MTIKERKRANYLETTFFHEHDYALTKDEFLFKMKSPFGFYGNEGEEFEEFILANIGNIRYGWKICASGSTYKLKKLF
jgi:hypothetical protein